MGQGTISQVDWRPDGEVFVVNSNQGAWLYSTNFELIEHIAGVTGVVFSPNSIYLAGIGRDGKVSLWEAANLTSSQALEIADYTTALAFSPDGQQLAGSGNNSVWIWDVAEAQPSQVLPRDFQVTSMAWSPSGDFLAVAGVNAVQVWDIQTGEHVFLDVPAGGTRTIYQVAWSTNGSRIATAAEYSDLGYANSLQIWDAATGNLLHVIQGGRILDLAWHPTEPLLTTALGRFDTGIFDSPSVQMWDPETGRAVTALGSYTQDVISFAWNADGTQLLVVTADNAVRIVDWPQTSVETPSILQGFMGAVTSLAWSPDGAQLVSGSEDGGVRVWNANTGEPFITLIGNEREVWSAAWSPDGSQVASGGADYTVRTWEVETGSMNLPYSHERFVFDNIPGVLAIAWTPGQYIASGGSDGTVRIPLPTKSRPEIVEGDSGSVFSVSWRSDGNQFVFANGTVELWDLAANEHVRTFTCDADGSWISAAFSPDGEQILGLANTGIACIWEAQTGAVLYNLDGLHAPLSWHPNSTELAALATEDPTKIQIWDVENQAVIATIETEAVVNALAWSPDGARIAAGDRDGIITIWEEEE